MDKFRILELFSGIGGMHYAFNYTNLDGEIVEAIDINPVATTVYEYNYPNNLVRNKNIQKLSPKYINNLEVNTILMSPPCQPFTRVGNQKDVDDSRTDALKHICDILKDLKTINFILMENVKGFEKSKARDIYLNALKDCGFYVAEFMLSPSQFGVPNTRYRYYCLARRKVPFSFETNEIASKLPSEMSVEYKKFSVGSMLEEDNSDKLQYLIEDDLLKKRVLLMDIVSPESTNTICFTKAYTHYVEGTGSVLTMQPKDEIISVFESLNLIDKNSDDYMKKLKSLSLRYFTPREVSRLMSFPEEFSFPSVTTTRQKYRLLGNSINVLVVGELIKILCSLT